MKHEVKHEVKKQLKSTKLTFVLSTSTSSAMLVGGPCDAELGTPLLPVIAPLLLLLVELAAAAVSDEVRGCSGSDALLCNEQTAQCVCVTVCS